jgi:WS/DGAT/MGAT family acyltransferase
MGRMKQLSALDALFLQLETPQMPMHVGSLNVYELPAGHRGSFVDDVRRIVKDRLPVLGPFRRRLWWMPLNLANPAWVDAEPDLEWHVVGHKVPRNGGMAALEDCTARLHAQLLDRARPLWRIHVIEGFDSGMPGRKWAAVYTQLHHAAVDGQAAVALAMALWDMTPTPRQLDPEELKGKRQRKHRYRLGVAEMLRAALQQEAHQLSSFVKELPQTVQTLRGALKQVLGSDSRIANLTLAPRTAFNTTITEDRSFACATLPLPELKAIGKAHGATLNDMVLLVCSGALRRYLLARQALPKKSLVAGVPITLREQGDHSASNQVSMSMVSLGTHLADPRRRLLHIQHATAAMKASMGSVKSILPTDLPSIGVPWLVQAATALYGGSHLANLVPQVMNLVISNVPGSPMPLYFAGARMLCVYPTSIVVHGVALNITLESYDQQMDFGIMADKAAMPDARALARAVNESMDELRQLHTLLQARAQDRAAAAPPAIKSSPASGANAPEADAAAN